MKFSEVIGQSEMVERLRRMADEQKVPHALMLCGQTGYGTFALAFALACYLLGERETGTNPSVEAMLRKAEHPDLHFVFPCIKPQGTSSTHVVTTADFIRQWSQLLQRTSYFSFEEWLEEMGAENQQAIIFAGEGDSLTHKLMLKSSQGGYKVCVIWLPERMHTTFANKILKILEEPPQQTVFILASEQPGQLLETIRSRVQAIDVKQISQEDIRIALQQKRGIGEDVARRVSRLANGNWLTAVGTLNASNENKQFLDMFMLLMRMAYQRDIKSLKKWSEAVASFGREKQKRMLVYFLSQVRENFMYNFRAPELTYMTQEEETFSTRFSRFINEANVIEIQELIERTIKAIGQNANPKMQFYDLALQMVVLLIRK